MPTTFLRLRQHFTTHQVFETLQPIFFLTFLYGLTPFCVTKSKGGGSSVKMSFFGFVNIALYILLYGGCYIISLMRDESVVGYFFRTKISSIGNTMQICNGLITGTVIYLSAIVRRNKLLQVINILHSLDENFLRIGIRVKYSRIYRYSIVMLAFKTIIIGVYFAGVYRLIVSMNSRPSFAVCVTFFLQHSVLFLAICLFCLVARSFERRLIILNKMTLWRDLVKPSDSFAAEQLLLWTTFSLGLTPLRISSDRCIHISRWGYVITALQMIFFMYCFIYSFMLNESIVGYFFRSEISQVGDSLQKIIGMFGMLILFAVSLYKSQDMMYIYRVMANIDCRFLELGVEFNYRFIMRFRATKLLFILSICVMYISSSFWMLFHNDVWPSFQAMVAFFLPHFYLLTVVVLIIAFIMRFTQYFQLLNKVLKNLSRQWETRSGEHITHSQKPLQYLDSFYIYTMVNKNPVDIIQESMDIHQLICEAASTANKYFTYQLLTIISIAFLIIVFDAYYVLETLLGKTRRESKFKTAEFVTFFFCQMVLYLIAIISIVEGSNRAVKMSEKTGGIVHGLLNKTSVSDVREKLLQFSMQLMHLRINFSAAGLFNIDRTLYFTISGALTTYLIILLQFTSSSVTASSHAEQDTKGDYIWPIPTHFIGNFTDI